jgi:hypothetical protein
VLAMVLIVIGIIHEIDDKTTTPPPLSKIGIVMLLLAWCVLAAWIAISLRNTEQSYSMIPLQTQGSREPAFGVAPAHAEATMVSYNSLVLSDDTDLIGSCFTERLSFCHLLGVAMFMLRSISSLPRQPSRTTRQRRLS